MKGLGLRGVGAVPLNGEVLDDAPDLLARLFAQAHDARALACREHGADPGESDFVVVAVPRSDGIATAQVAANAVVHLLTKR